LGRSWRHTIQKFHISPQLNLLRFRADDPRRLGSQRKRGADKQAHTMIFELLIASVGLLITTILMIAIILCMEQRRRQTGTTLPSPLPINESNRQSLEPSRWIWSPFAPSAPHLSLCEEARVEPQLDVRRQTTLTSFTEHM
jgi:hypothetical protein